MVLGHRRPFNAYVELQHRRAEASVRAGQDGEVGEIDARVVVCSAAENDAGRVVEAISIAEQHGRRTISRVCPKCKGVSLGTRINQRRSIKTTSAARRSNLSLKLWTMPERVFIDQLTTAIPSVL